jgi:predicted ATPase/DNA-binding SARP family transcriptional activator
MDPVRIGMLGPLEVYDDDDDSVALAGLRLRTLLIALALSPGRVVSTTRLVDAVWGDQPPAGAVNALQALVSRLRRALPGTRIELHPRGYLLMIDPDAVDVTRFERLVAAGRAALSDDPASATQTLREALALWRGPAMIDVADQEYFHATITRLEELRLTATEDRIEAELRLGRGPELVTELTALTLEHPLRERLVGALMRALSDAGRPAEALAVYERTRAVLAEQLGTDPSPQLSALHIALLRGEMPLAPAPIADLGAPTNLPAPLTSFIGRDADVARVIELTEEYRLTTLVGPGGAGKTRLAIEASRPLLDRTPDGIWLVELDRVTDPADLPAAVLAALRLRDPSLIDRAKTEEPIGRLAAALRNRSILLVLDNCEHLIAAAAALTERLLGECPRLRILATSREPLGIAGEAVWPVEPLALPAADEKLDAVDLLSYDAVRLFVERARAARPGFAVTDNDVPVLIRICRALDGMPLALELAAARLRTMTAAQLADHLDDRFRLLTAGSRTAAHRHQTLRAVVDWSWELLADSERAVLRRLAVFASGATLEAAERVCAGDPVDAADVLGLLTSLVDKSLVVAGGDDVQRYRMLETIKAYCLERLAETGELENVRRAYASYFVELAETAEPHLRRAEQLEWLRRLEVEHDNLHAAIRGAIAAGDAQTAVRLVAAAGWYWWLGGHKAEGLRLATEALALPGEVDAATRAEACAFVAYFTTAGLGDLRQAEPWIREAQQLAKELDRPGPLLRHLLGVFAAVESGRGTSAIEALAPLVADEDPWVRAQTRLARWRLLSSEDQETDIQSALVELRSIGERWGISYALTLLGELAARRGDLKLALDYCAQAAHIFDEIGAREDLVFLRARQAQLAWLAGDTTGSSAAMAQAEHEAKHVAWADAHAALAYAKGDLARWSGDLVTARTELGRVESVLPSGTVDLVFRAMILDSLSYVDAAEGDLDTAGARRAEAVDIALGPLDPALLCQVLVGVADQAMRCGRPYEAARLLGAAEAVGGGVDHSRPDGARIAAAIQAALGESAYVEALGQARAEFSGARRGELTTLEAVRELTTSVLSAQAPKAG